MEVEEKLRLLGGTEDLDEEGTAYSPAHSPQMRQAPGAAGVYWAAAGGRRRVPLLRALRTNVCELDCRYCAINRHRDARRASFRPEELARTFMQMAERGMVAGLFLSSGVAGGADRSAEKIIETAEILRCRYRYRGYIHLKIMPGQSPDYVLRAFELADRVSINLEAPTPEHLARIAPSKDFWRDLVAPMREVQRLQSRHPDRLRAGQITQMVVGAAGDSDRDILTTTQWLYDELGMRRVYYSAYHPVCGEVLAPPAPKLREHRLYQADWLLRFYGFRLEELPFQADGSLPQHMDPKLAWALRHPELFPVEVNRAPREWLLRVPGIGPESASRILRRRRQGAIRGLEELRALGVVVGRALPFVLLDGRYLADRAAARALWARNHEEAPRQLSLPWESAPLAAAAAAAGLRAAS
ncbi:MAG TPA: radical SAM protein [Dehalococcoidia bacterium]|nr:radical SAM protein [Dehalococcoidia bacterium]